MKNVKDQVYNALESVFGDSVSDQYPKEWAHIPALQYVEEENKVYERTGNKEDKAYVRYRIDIWDNKSTSGTAVQVDDAVSALGLVRISCQDTPDPSGLKHKVMRYEGIIDTESDIVYWPA